MNSDTGSAVSLTRPGHRGRRRAAAAAAVAMIMVLVGVGTAYAASTSWTTAAPQGVANKAQFTGQYRWWSATENHGAFEIKGAVADLNKTNGRRVKFQVRVAGYSPDVYNATTDKDLTVPAELHWRGDTTLVINAYIQTCQVNVLADDCTTWRHYVNPFS